MSTILKRVVISFGLALIIGVIVGFVQSVDKYYLLDPNEPKREITKETANERRYKEYSSKEYIFNSTQGLMFGVASFGGFLVISMLLKKRS